MTATVTFPQLGGLSIELSDDEYRRLEAAIDDPGLGPDEFFTQSALWGSANLPDLAKEIGKEHRRRATKTSEKGRAELKMSAKREFLKRRTMKFVEYVLSDKSPDAADGEEHSPAFECSSCGDVVAGQEAAKTHAKEEHNAPDGAWSHILRPT